MIATVTNVSGHALNVPDTYQGAVGGNVVDPLPYPFAHVGELANNGTAVFSVHEADWRKKVAVCGTFEAREEWNMLIQANKITLTVAAEATSKDIEDYNISQL